MILAFLGFDVGVVVCWVGVYGWCDLGLVILVFGFCFV